MDNTLRSIYVFLVMAAFVAMVTSSIMETKGQGGHSASDKRLNRNWKTGPSMGSWYYIMGHPPSRKRSIKMTEQLQHMSRDTTGGKLLEDFVLFLDLLEQGRLDGCLRKSYT